MTTRRVYRLPAHLGGQEVRLISSHGDGRATVDAGGYGEITIPVDWLDITDEPVADEPQIGSVVLDRDGDPWKHKESGWVNSPAGDAIPWEALQAKWGPTQLLHADTAARTPAPAVPIDAEPLPLRLLCADGRRELVIEEGKLPGDVRFQTIEGDFHSRGAVLDHQAAARAAWAILQAVAR